MVSLTESKDHWANQCEGSMRPQNEELKGWVKLLRVRQGRHRRQTTEWGMQTLAIDRHEVADSPACGRSSRSSPLSGPYTPAGNLHAPHTRHSMAPSASQWSAHQQHIQSDQTSRFTKACFFLGSNCRAKVQTELVKYLCLGFKL